jgi:uncharacterized protein (TIGR02300 family)
MSKKEQRGTKRTCQSASCGTRFYDLNRDPIACPICGTVFESSALPVAMAAAAAPAAAVADRPARRPAKKPEFVEADVAPVAAPEVVGEDALVDVEGAEEPIAAVDDETFLEEEEEDSGDVSGIIGGGGEGEEEV